MDNPYIEAIAVFMEEYPGIVDLDSWPEVTKAIGAAEKFHQTISAITREAYSEQAQQENKEEFLMSTLHTIKRETA